MKGKRKRHPRRLLVGERVYIQPRGKRRIYQADIQYKGQHYRRSLKTRNLRIARARALQFERDVFEGKELFTSTAKEKAVIIIAAIASFISFLTTEGRRRKTTARYNGILQGFATFAESESVTNLTQVNLGLIDKFREQRRETLKPKSMHNEGSLLKHFFNWCVERELIGRNPLEKRKFVAPKPKDRLAPTLEQVNQILAAATPLRFPVLAVLAFTGMRSGEARNLRPEDIDLKGNWIHIRSRDGYETKTGQERKVPIHPRLRKILEELSTHARPWLFTALPSKKFPQGDHHINVKQLNEELQEWLPRIGLPKGRENGFTIHSLRRFVRTFCVNANIPERVVDIWLGHLDKKSMGGVYYHLSDQQSQEFMLKVPFGDGALPSDSEKK